MACVEAIVCSVSLHIELVADGIEINIAIEWAMKQNTIKKVSRREQSTEACSAGARHARGGAVRGAQGGVGGVVAALSSWRLCTRSVRT